MNNEYEELRLLAQVCLDGELGGGPFEGNNVFYIIKGLTEFLQIFKSYGKLTSAENKFYTYLFNNNKKALDSCEKLCEKLLFVADIDKKILNLTHQTNLDKKDETINLCNNIAHSILDKLAKEKDVFFPGGWGGAAGGHAILHRLFYDKENLIFLAYNTGAGTKYHKQCALTNDELLGNYKEKFNSAYAIKFDDKIALQQYGGMHEWLNRLIAPLFSFSFSNKAYTTYNEEIIYEHIFAESHHLKGKIVDPSLYWQHTTSGQRDGTCVQQSIQRLLEDFFPHKLDYRYFLLLYRMHLLENAITKFKRNYQNIAYQDFFNRAIANTARMLDDNKQLGVIFKESTNPEEKELRSLLVERISQLTHQVAAFPKLGNNAKLDLSLSIEKNIKEFELNKNLNKLENSLQDKSSNLKLSSESPIIFTSYLDSLEILTSFLSKIKKREEDKIIDILQNETFYFYTSEFCLKFCGEKDILPKNIQPNQIKESIQKIIKIIDTISTVENIYPAHFMAVSLSLIHFITLSLEIYDNLLHGVDTDATSNAALIQELQGYILQTTQRNSLLASTSPIVQELWVKLYSYYQLHGNTYTNYVKEDYLYKNNTKNLPVLLPFVLKHQLQALLM